MEGLICRVQRPVNFHLPRSTASRLTSSPTPLLRFASVSSSLLMNASTVSSACLQFDSFLGRSSISILNAVPSHSIEDPTDSCPSIEVSGGLESPIFEDGFFIMSGLSEEEVIKHQQLSWKIDKGKALLISTVVGLVALSVLASRAYLSTCPGTFQIELLSSGWTGFFAGCLHTLSGPDHLASLAPLSIGRTSWESMTVGAFWGLGHDAGQILFGLLFLLLRDRLHIEVIQSWGTWVVGLTLLVIGALGIKEAKEVPVPCVPVGDGEADTATVEPAKHKKNVGFATFATGIIHGLQPDALVMILPALALPSRLAGAAFLAMFLLGTVVAMGSYTVFVGSCCQVLKDRIPRITEKLTWISSLAAIGLGGSILISQLLGFSLY